MAKSVIFAMIGSFLLSRTFVPTFANYILKNAHAKHEHASGHLEYVMESTHTGHTKPAHGSGITGYLKAFQHGFEKRFHSIQQKYLALLRGAIESPKKFMFYFMLFVIASYALVLLAGREFFPRVDGGQIKIHVRLPTGTRLEETVLAFNQIENTIKQVVHEEQIETLIDNIGLTSNGINLAYSNSGTIGPQDGDILISLKEDHEPSEAITERLRDTLIRAYPSYVFSFLPADIVSQILNFGAPAPIDIIVKGPNRDGNAQYASQVLAGLRKIPGVVDARIQQATNYPQLNVDIDRIQAAKIGITQRDVTNNMVTTLAGSSQVSPSFWLNPANGVSYPIVVQTPQPNVSSVSDLMNIPIASASGTNQTILGGLSTIRRGSADAVVSHDSIQPSFDVFADTQGRDLGAVASDIQKMLNQMSASLPKGSRVEIRGQVSTMNSAFQSLGFGLIASIIFIYLVLVINFQSWLDPFIIITALPAAIAGILWMLFISVTNLSVPALTGMIMCMGVATANSILVVSFARERFQVTHDSKASAIEAGFSRFRPVMMTALAMIIGMAPMALGLGEGGEQNAPLGRAVIGGLIFATVATLIFVPIVFSYLHRARTNPTSATQQHG